MQVNSWLRNWCWQEGFGLYNHGTLYADPGLPGRDGIPLTKGAKESLSVGWLTL